MDAISNCATWQNYAIRIKIINLWFLFNASLKDFSWYLVNVLYSLLIQIISTVNTSGKKYSKLVYDLFIVSQKREDDLFLLETKNFR